MPAFFPPHGPLSIRWEEVTQIDAVASGYTLQPRSREALVESESVTERASERERRDEGTREIRQKERQAERRKR